MSIFKRRPTAEQRRKLQLIEDSSQRRALLDAIQRGEPIPDYAWTPSPPQDEQERKQTTSRLLSMVADSVASSWLFFVVIAIIYS